MPSLPAEEARRRFTGARVARLATADAAGRPHVVPFAFAVEGNVIYSAVDAKPKRSTALRRLANLAENPAVAALADHYDDLDWEALWWVRAEGTGRILAPASGEGRRAVDLLCRRYPQYAERPPAGPVVAIDVHRWAGWAAAPPASPT